MAVKDDLKPAGAPTEELPLSLYSWVVIGLCLLTYAVSFVSRATWSTAIPIAAPQLNLSNAAAGGLMTAFYIGYVASNFPAGFLVDKFGPRLSLGISTIISGIFTLMFPFADNYALLFITRIGAGLGGGCIMAAGVKYQLSWFPKSARGTAMGIMFAGPSLGTAIASGVMAPIVSTSGWQTAFIYASVATLVIGVGMLLFGKERGVSAVRKPKIVQPKPEETASNTPAAKEAEESLMSILLKRSYILGIIACFLMLGAGQGFTTWIIVFLTNARGLSLVVAGGIFAASSITAMFAPTVAGFLSDLLKRRKIVALIGCVATAITIAALAIFTNTAVLWVLMLIRGLVSAFVGTPLNTLQAESVTGAKAGAAMGVYNGLGQLGSLIYPISLGLILDLTSNNYFIVLIAIAVTYALCGLCVSLMDEKLKVNKNAKVTV